MAKSTLQKLNPIRLAINLVKWAIVGQALRELDADIGSACGKGHPKLVALDVEFRPAEK